MARAIRIMVGYRERWIVDVAGDDANRVPVHATVGIARARHA
jgi:hypothetical protein